MGVCIDEDEIQGRTLETRRIILSVGTIPSSVSTEQGVHDQIMYLVAIIDANEGQSMPHKCTND